jgi:hypothetical protein
VADHQEARLHGDDQSDFICDPQSLAADELYAIEELAHEWLEERAQVWRHPAIQGELCLEQLAPFGGEGHGEITCTAACFEPPRE